MYLIGLFLNEGSIFKDISIDTKNSSKLAEKISVCLLHSAELWLAELTELSDTRTRCQYRPICVPSLIAEKLKAEPSLADHVAYVNKNILNIGFIKIKL